MSDIPNRSDTELVFRMGRAKFARMLKKDQVAPEMRELAECVRDLFELAADEEAVYAGGSTGVLRDFIEEFDTRAPLRCECGSGAWTRCATCRRELCDDCIEENGCCGIVPAEVDET